MTLFAIGPMTSRVGTRGTVPPAGTSPSDGLRPTRPLKSEGMRIEPPVSPPMPNMARFAPIAAPVPELEPPGVRLGSYGLRTGP